MGAPTCARPSAACAAATTPVKIDGTIQRALQTAIAHHGAGHFAEAEAIYRRILEAQPRHPDAWHLLGVIAHQAGRSDIAVDFISRSIRLNSRNPAAHSNLGLAHARNGQLDRALAAYRRALELKPDHAEAHHGLGTVLATKGELEPARASYERALRFDRNHVNAHYNLGTTLAALDRLDEAIASYRRALALAPEHLEALTNLGAVFAKKGELDEARACYEKALALKPDHVEARNNLAGAQKDQGLLDDAIASYRQAVALNPKDPRFHSNLVYALHFHPGYDARAIHAEHLRWAQAHAAPLKSFLRPHTNDPNPDRRLRVGYVSPDFCEHPVGRFLLPLLGAHDHENVEVFCYSDVRHPDPTTDQLRAHADVWRDTAGVSDGHLAGTIREDRIDLLVDLTMHMAHNRLPLFARKPAPVQVTYLAYASTTGLDTIDYRLTDPFLDPPGSDDRFYSERSVRLPETYWCYQPGIATPDVSPLPALPAGGRVTFGCLNNFCKVTSATLTAWGQLLCAVPGSMLVLHAREGSHRARVRETLAHVGVDPARVRFIGYVSLREYFESYHSIDIGLDPFPYTGGTTTCDALWMGVPVVTLAGDTAFSRGGLSLLSNLGLPELAAHDTEEYVEIAAGLARNLPRLAELRASLRERVQRSPLTDAPRFARHMERAYREMWRGWCQTQRRQ